MTDFRALCAELVDDLELCDWPYKLRDTIRADIDRARAALAEQPVEPTDDELLRTYSKAVTADMDEQRRSLMITIDFDRSMAAGLRAILVRWGQPAAAPVPVSERLPGPEDYDAEGYCWRWNTIGGLWARQSLGRSWYEFESHWLPAHALPVSTVEEVM